MKAIAVADLEARNGYNEFDHDPFFEVYGENSLTADDLSLFPDYLVCIPPDRNDAPENAGLMDTLSSGLPVKVVVQVTDLLEEASLGTGHFAFGVRSARLATTAMGLGGMFVLQAASSSLYRMRNRIENGMGCRGPALFSVFAGAPAAAGALPRYMTSAAAMESRAFPAFVYDAAAGENWAERFSLESNRNPDTDWPVEPFEYADEAMQRVAQQVAFTYADFAMCDRRNAEHFAVVPRDRWTSALVPVADWLALSGARGRGARSLPARRRRRRRAAPGHRRREDDAGHPPLPAAVAPAPGARRHPRFPRRAPARPREGRVGGAEERGTRGAAQVRGRRARRRGDGRGARAAAAAAPRPRMPQPAAEAKPPSDDPWIETSRCPSCNECQLINPQMFGYNDNKQAFIKDLNAGTYRQLVEAAEACQVAIIHPGKPRNPSEPGLDELIKRAEPFNA